MGSEQAPRTDLTDQAIEWLVRLDAGKADPEAFEQWRNQDARHAAIFAQVASTWQRTGEIRGAGVDAAPQPATPPLVMPEPTAQPKAVANRRRVLGGLAASLAIAMGGGGYLLWPRRAWAETGVGERRVVQLPDGSRAELNTDSRIGWRLDGAMTLWVERGEAALTVAGNATHAFAVHTAPASARLADGRYSLRLRDAELRLIALAGEASVLRPDGSIALTIRAGGELSANAKGLRQARLTAADLDAATAWQRGEIVFDGMTLASALGEFNRYLPRPIELGDPALGATRLGGRFRTDDVQGFLQALHDGFGIDSQRIGDRTILVPRR